MAANGRDAPGAPDKTDVATDGQKRQRDIEVRRLECELNKKDLEMNKKDLEMNKKDLEMNKKDLEMNKKDLEMNKKDLEMNKKDLEMNKKDLEMNKKDLEMNKLRKKGLQLHKIIENLNEDVSDLKKSVAALESQNRKMEGVIRDYEARIDYYENAHVPPSRQGPFHKNGGGAKSGKDKTAAPAENKGDAPGGAGGTRAAGRGGVRGHRGGTRIFRPAGTARHTAACFPNCKKTNMRERGNDRKRPMVSIPEFVPYTVTLHRTAGYDCLDCGEEFRADDGLPPHGRFDWSVIRHVTYQYGHRKTAGMIAGDPASLYGLGVSDETVREIFRRGTRMAEPARDGYMAEPEKSPAVTMDETDYEGEPKRWTMAVRNDDTVVYAHAQSRGAVDLISQAADCVGTIARDGYPGYDAVFEDSEMQRCTQHVGREGKNIAKRTELNTADKLCRELSEKLAMPRRRTRDRHSAKSRIAYVDKLQEWLRGIISRYRKSRHEKLKKFGTAPENAAPHLFTFSRSKCALYVTTRIKRNARNFTKHYQCRHMCQ